MLNILPNQLPGQINIIPKPELRGLSGGFYTASFREIIQVKRPGGPSLFDGRCSGNLFTFNDLFPRITLLAFP